MRLVVLMLAVAVWGCAPCSAIAEREPDLQARLERDLIALDRIDQHGREVREAEDALDAFVRGTARRVSGHDGSRGALEFLRRSAIAEPGAVLVDARVGRSMWTVALAPRPAPLVVLGSPWDMDPIPPSACGSTRGRVIELQRRIREVESAIGGDALRKDELREELAAARVEMDRLVNAVAVLEHLPFETFEVRSRPYTHELEVQGTLPVAASTPSTARDPFRREL